MELSNVSFLSNNATNCITQVPQDIKLDLINGVLTLRAGSKVYYPDGLESNGTPKFSYIITEEDIINTDYDTEGVKPDLWIAATNGSALYGWPTDICYSGPTEPSEASGTTWALWYDTSENKIKVKSNTATWSYGAFTFPIGVGYNTTTHVSDQIISVFNGAGFIGNYYYILPGVKGVSPNGFDKNGATKNVEVEVPKIIVSYLNPAWGTGLNNHIFYIRYYYSGYSDNQPDYRFAYSKPGSTWTGAFWNSTRNKWDWYSEGQTTDDLQRFIIVGSFLAKITSATKAAISNFNPPKVFQAENTENISEDYSFGETFTGKYFVNGKKIYQITVRGTTPATDGTWASATIPSEIQVAWIKDGFIQGSNGYFYPIVVYNDASPIGESFVQINPSTPAVAILVKGSYLRSNPFYLTINYTKLSDT